MNTYHGIVKGKQGVFGRLDATCAIRNDSRPPAHARSISCTLVVLCHTPILHVPDCNIVAITGALSHCGKEPIVLRKFQAFDGALDACRHENFEKLPKPLLISMYTHPYIAMEGPWTKPSITTIMRLQDPCPSPRREHISEPKNLVNDFIDCKQDT